MRSIFNLFVDSDLVKKANVSYVIALSFFLRWRIIK